MSAPPATREGRTRGRAALPALVLAVLAADLLWLALDASPMSDPNDPYAFLVRTQRLLQALRSGAPEGLGSALAATSLHGRPPLYQLLSAPFLLLFGSSARAALLVNLGFAVLLLVAVHALARAIAGARAGIVAAATAAAYPPLVLLARSYRPHFAVAACTALSFLLLLRLARRRTPRRAWAFGASLGFGLLIHPTFAWTLALPSAAAALALVFLPASAHRGAPQAARSTSHLAERLRDPFLVRGLLPAALLAALPPAAWYLGHGVGLLAMGSRLAASDRVATLGFPGVPASFAWYLRTAPGALSIPLTALALFGVVSALARREPAPRALALAALAAYAVLSQLWALGWWYFAPVLPLLAVLGAVALERAPLPRLGAAVALAAAALVFGITSFGAPGPLRAVARALGSPLGRPACASLLPAAFCPAPPRGEAWPVDELLAAVAADRPECADGSQRCRVFLAIPREMAAFGLVERTITSAYFDWRTAVRLPAARLAFPNANTAGCGLSNLAKSDYALVFEASPDLVAGCHAAWLRLLASPPPAFSLAFRPLADLPLPQRGRARLYTRHHPLGPAALSELAAALERSSGGAGASGF